MLEEEAKVTSTVAQEGEEVQEEFQEEFQEEVQEVEAMACIILASILVPQIALDTAIPYHSFPPGSSFIIQQPRKITYFQLPRTQLSR